MNINPRNNVIHSLVLLMVLLSNYLRSSSWLSLPCMLSLVRLGVGTAVWYLFAGVVFPYVEHVTGGWLLIYSAVHQGPDHQIHTSPSHIHISSSTQRQMLVVVTSYTLTSIFKGGKGKGQILGIWEFSGKNKDYCICIPDQD